MPATPHIVDQPTGLTANHAAANFAANFAARREALRPLMRKAGLSALLVTLDADRYYLRGFELCDPQADESSGRLIIRDNGRDILCTDSRFFEAARRLWPEEDIFIYRGNAAEQINTLLRENVSGVVGFDGRHMTVRFYDEVSSGLSLQRADGMVESLRLIKDAEEIRRMRLACRLNHKLMEWVPGILVPGRTEAQVAWDIEQFFRNNGAEGLAFSSIVAVGPNAALPHAVPGEDIIRENCGVLIDVGCRLNDYCSDQTRSFWVGETPSPRWAKDLELIQEAQRRAIEVIRPGIPACDVYTPAKAYLDAEGVGALFTHGLGHGIGLQTHEPPSLNPSNRTILRPGMIITVEPGLYRAGENGVRWEYMVLVTEDGAEVL